MFLQCVCGFDGFGGVDGSDGCNLASGFGVSILTVGFDGFDGFGGSDGEPLGVSFCIVFTMFLRF